MAQAAKVHAKNLRRSMTKPERLLWHAMRARNFGYKVRRQHPLGRFTLDFFIPEAMICIEVDGQGHELREAYDDWRDQQLRKAGVTTIRVRAASVLRDPYETAHAISMSIRERSVQN